MTAPELARLAAKALAEEDAPVAYAPEASPALLAALEGAIAARGRRSRLRRGAMWGGLVAAAAAALVVVLRGHLVGERDGGALPAALVRADGDVRLVDAAGVAARASPRPLAAGSRVLSGPGGEALVRWTSGTSVTVEERSEALLVSTAPRTRLVLVRGALSAHVARQAEREAFVVATPDAEVEVRGTAFRVVVRDAPIACSPAGRTAVRVLEGVVVVRHGAAEARVRAGEAWPPDCPRPAEPGRAAPTVHAADPGAAQAPAGAAPASRGAPPGERSLPPGRSTLAAQNDAFARALVLRRSGDPRAALSAFEEFLARYPEAPLAESAEVERVRLLARVSPVRGREAARRYLERWPHGFAVAEMAEVVAGPR